MLQIPEHIETFICPGQHDAVRRAEPQPAIPPEFVPRLHKTKNFHFIGNPSWVEIEGLKTLIYHGASLHPLYTALNLGTQKEPHKAIIEVLKRRDLMTSYGTKNPYAPEKGFMLIKEQPDIYIGGDMHHTGYGQYKSCTIINSGTWQKQTTFQISQGHYPTPGTATQIELETRKITEHNFIQKKK
jgi:DNA polymerase II small subunit